MNEFKVKYVLCFSLLIQMRVRCPSEIPSSLPIGREREIYVSMIYSYKNEIFLKKFLFPSFLLSFPLFSPTFLHNITIIPHSFTRQSLHQFTPLLFRHMQDEMQDTGKKSTNPPFAGFLDFLARACILHLLTYVWSLYFGSIWKTAISRQKGCG